MINRWQLQTLGDVCHLDRGLTYSKTDEVTLSSNIVLRANNIDLETGRLSLSDLRYISDHVAIPVGKRAREGSLLICTASGSRAHLGKVALVDKPIEAAFGGFMGQITPRAGISPRFLFHLLMAPRFKEYLLSLAGGTNINNLRLGDVAKFEFLLPDLAEQQRIVAILDEAFEGITAVQAKAEESRANARLVGQTALSTVLERGGDGWEDVALGDIATVASGAGFPELLQGQADQTFAFFKVGDMNALGNEQAMLVPRHTISEEVRRSLNARVFPVGSVIFPKVGGAIATDKKRLVGRPCCVDNNVMGVIPKPELLDSRLLHQLLRNKQLTDFSNDAGLPSIRKTTVEAWRVRLPTDVSAQRALAERLEAIGSGVQELIVIYDRKLAGLAELKQSLLARAFSGELTRGPLTA